MLRWKRESADHPLEIGWLLPGDGRAASPSVRRPAALAPFPPASEVFLTPLAPASRVGGRTCTYGCPFFKFFSPSKEKYFQIVPQISHFPLTKQQQQQKGTVT